MRVPVVLRNPRITEKASIALENNAYTFNVHESVTKTDIAKEIHRLYKVTPIKVHVITKAYKAKFRRGQRGRVGGGKKAIVFLKKGDTIDLA